jgi:hypothetical protein
MARPVRHDDPTTQSQLEDEYLNASMSAGEYFGVPDAPRGVEAIGGDAGVGDGFRFSRLLA